LGKLPERLWLDGDCDMIFDCFLFFNELELLDLRLATLAECVDKFILVEMTVTHQGKPKPLYYADNKDRYQRYAHKIVHVVIDDCPISDSWRRENFHRNGVMRGLQDCAADDVILISDVDEIPKPELVISHKNDCDVMVFNQQLYYYYFNCECIDWRNWAGTNLIQYHLLRKTSPQSIRQTGKPIEFGGWHFSYLGGAKRIEEKLKAFCHTEYNTAAWIANVPKALAALADPFDRGFRFQKVTLDDSFPSYLVQNRNQFESMILA
jgi:beta-1,4-mannosyl-glycoprotein beta-1,4-N-acetylglucosaminyltransferase